jgi:hypothetical protein
MAADGSVIIDTRMDTSGVQNGVSAIRQSFNGLGSVVKKIGVLIGGAFAIGKLTQFGKECVELGSNLAEVQNVVDVTFTTMSDKVNEFAKNAMTSAGLSETMAKQYVGTFGAMSKSFGFSEAQAYDMSTALTQLTGDVASFYNISQDLAYTKLKSVFTGETETLKDLGVVMTQSALDQYALANGYGKTTSEMTEQEKVALRLAFVQKQLSAASGDFIRTSDSWANQVKVMQLQLQSLKATVGQGLINLFTPVLRVINILLGKLATLANAFKSFTELITGKKSSGQTGASGAGLVGTDAIADTADQYGDAANNAEKLADATNDTADATKKATKAAKGYLSPLDEINNYSTDKSTDSSSKVPGATGGLADQMKDAVQNVDYGKLAEGETVLDKMSKPLKKIIDRFKQLAKLIAKGFWDGLGDYEPILDGIKKDLDSIWKSLKDSNKGLYLSNGNVYMNADYINTGELAGWEVGHKKLSASGTYGEVTLDASTGEIYSETNTGVYVPGYGTLYGTRIRGINLYTGTVHASSASFNTSVSASSVSASSVSASGKVKAGTHVEASGHFYSIGTGTDLADASIRGKLKVSGTKSRSVSTVDYDEQLFYCYEMSTPFFGDIGESVISDDGTCMIDIDDIFQESANVGIKYYVFLQREGEGDCWIAEKEQNYFVVKGTPGLKFSFEIKARQAEYEHMRFTDPGDTAYTDARDIEIPEPDYESEETEVPEPDYESELTNDRLSIINQMEVIS